MAHGALLKDEPCSRPRHPSVVSSTRNPEDPSNLCPPRLNERHKPIAHGGIADSKSFGQLLYGRVVLKVNRTTFERCYQKIDGHEQLCRKRVGFDFNWIYACSSERVAPKRSPVNVYGALKLGAVETYMPQFMGKREPLPVASVQSVDANDPDTVPDVCEPREFIIKRRILDPDAERLGNSLDGHRGRFDAILDQQRLRRLPGFAPVGPPLHRERRFRSLPAKADSSKPCTADCCFRLNVESLTSIAGSGSPDAHVLGTRSNTDSSFRVLTRAKS